MADAMSKTYGNNIQKTIVPLSASETRFGVATV